MCAGRRQQRPLPCSLTPRRRRTPDRARAPIAWSAPTAAAPTITAMPMAMPTTPAAAGFGGGGCSGKRSLEGTFLPGCILTARAAARSILGGG